MTRQAAAPLAALTLLLALLPAGTASAGRVVMDAEAGILSYVHATTVEADRAHDVRFDVVDGGERYRISDRSALVVICGVDATVESCEFPAPCIHEGGNLHEATCVAAGVTEFDVFLGDLNDRVVNTTDVGLVACGGPGADVIVGGAGRDTLGGGADRDELRGGAGDDRLLIDLARVLGSDDAPPPRVCLPGTDNPRRELLDGGPGVDRLEGGPGDDLLRGGDGEDLVFAYEGNDRLEGGEGGDFLLGLDGADAIAAGGGDDFVFGGEGNDAIDGEAGDDRLGLTVRYNDDRFGIGDQDVTTTEAGDDRFEGGPGDDTFMAGPGETVIDLIDPFATLAALRRAVINRDLQSDVLNGADRYIGGPGEDRVSYLNRDLPVEVSLDGASNDGSRGEGDGVDPDIELVMGGAGDDLLTAAPAGTFIFGDLGADSIAGGPGPDVLNGGSDDDDDRVTGAEGDDELRGGPGEDELDGRPGARRHARRRRGRRAGRRSGRGWPRGRDRIRPARRRRGRRLPERLRARAGGQPLPAGRPADPRRRRGRERSCCEADPAPTGSPAVRARTWPTTRRTARP